MICSHQGTNEPLGLVAAQWPGRQVDTDPTHTAWVWSLRSQPKSNQLPRQAAGQAPS